MKIQIRRNVFETNSSNEHSLTVMNNEKFKLWKLGKLLARIKNSQEANDTWGNFWSEMYTLEFTDDFEMAHLENSNIIEAVKRRGLEAIEDYKNRCLNYKKKIEKELTSDEYKKLTLEERNKYESDLYEDSYHIFDEEYYNKEKELYENLTEETLSKRIGLMHKKYWMTYEEFWNDFIENNDCYSPFEHEDLENNVHIIGKYFHS